MDGDFLKRTRYGQPYLIFTWAFGLLSWGFVYNIVGMNFAYLREEGATVAFRETLGGPVVRELAEAARRHRIHLLLGSIPEAARGGRVDPVR